MAETEDKAAEAAAKTDETKTIETSKAASFDEAEFKQLRESVAKLEQNNQALLKEKAEAKKKAEDAMLEAAKKGGDIEAVEKSWMEKYAKLEAESNESNVNYQGMINNLTVGAAASAIAAEIAVPGSADVLNPHIKSRLTVEIKDGKPSTRVLDVNGQPSAATLQELAEEFKNMPAFAPIIVGSLARGAGGAGGEGEGESNTMTREKYRKLTPQQQSEFIIKKGGKLID